MEKIQALKLTELSKDFYIVVSSGSYASIYEKLDGNTFISKDSQIFKVTIPIWKYEKPKETIKSPIIE